MSETIPMGFCQCGCGERTNLARQSSTVMGYKKGHPYRFISGHGKRGERHHKWNGGKRIDLNGYVHIVLPEHPRADTNGYVLEHIVIAEKALGKPLPKKAVVHHFDENPSHNQNGNLIICEDRNYHNLLHLRQNAIRACGNPNYRKCLYCKIWDDPRIMYIRPKAEGAWHRRCHNRDQQLKLTQNREKINQQRRDSWLTNREARNRRQNEWKTKNPEKIKLYNERRRLKREAQL